jgi:hypothetical protein
LAELDTWSAFLESGSTFERWRATALYVAMKHDSAMPSSGKITWR